VLTGKAVVFDDVKLKDTNNRRCWWYVCRQNNIFN
jgi:hypothetical protein